MKLQSKTAIVTGAGRGIGKAISIALAHEGANVVVSARTRSEIDDVAHDIESRGGHALAVPADVSIEADVQNLIDRTIQRFKTVDILINNAGFGILTKVEEMPVNDFDRMWAVNMRGVFLCTKAVLPLMMKQKSGDILNISSLAGRNAFIGGAGYGATKWALIGFARSLMLEVREQNIRVITLCPGSVNTTFGQSSGRPIHHSAAIPTADDIARVAVDTLTMPRNVLVSEVDIRPTNPKS